MREPTIRELAGREHTLCFAHPAPGTTPEGGGHLLRWRGAALVGIVNVTPDSFSDGGRLNGTDAAVVSARAMGAAGALMIDVGGESTRPGADPVPLDEELRRVLPVIERLVDDGAQLIGVDTMKPEVARAALRAGAHLVNDVGGLGDPRMVEVVAGAEAPAIVMHMRGSPATMQVDPRYDDVVSEVERFLAERASAALAAGVSGVVIDPGIGFGKRFEHNLALLRRLDRLTAGPHPLMLGASRKGFLGRLTGVERPEARDPASLAVNLYGARLGAALLRVHDVPAHRQALAVWEALDG